MVNTIVFSVYHVFSFFFAFADGFNFQSFSQRFFSFNNYENVQNMVFVVAEASETGNSVRKREVNLIFGLVTPPPIDTAQIVNKLDDVEGFIFSSNTRFETILADVDKNINLKTSNISSGIDTIEKSTSNLTSNFDNFIGKFGGVIGDVASDTAQTVATVASLDKLMGIKLQNLNDRVEMGTFSVTNLLVERFNKTDKNVNEKTEDIINRMGSYFSNLINIFSVGNTTVTVSDSNDSKLVKFFKSGFNYVYEGIENVSRTINSVFSVSNTSVSHSEVGDSKFVQMIKSGFNFADYGIDNLTITLNRMFSVGVDSIDYMDYRDSPFVKLLKNGFNRVIETIRENSDDNETERGEDESNYDFSEIESLLNSLFEKGEKIHRNSVNKIFNELTSLPALMTESLTNLFIPKDLSVINKEYDNFKNIINYKFGNILNSISIIKNLLSVKQLEEYPDIDIDFKFGKLYDKEIGQKVKYKGEYITNAAKIAKPFLTGFIFLWFLKEQYDWLHERKAIIE